MCIDACVHPSIVHLDFFEASSSSQLFHHSLQLCHEDVTVKAKLSWHPLVSFQVSIIAMRHRDVHPLAAFDCNIVGSVGYFRSGGRSPHQEARRRFPALSMNR